MKFAAFARSPLLSVPLPLWRSRLVLALLLIALASLIGRSLYLQSINTSFLQKKGESRYERVLDIPATRGRILDREGNPLAVSTPVKSMWSIPQDAELTPQQARDLARLLDLNVRDLNNKLNSERNFVYLQRRIAPDVANKILAMGLPGIFEQTEYRRFYPSGEIMSHMLGFTGDGDAGQEGVERAFNSELAGIAGSRRVIKDRRGQVVEDAIAIKEPRQGNDIALALDSKIQYLAYSNLQRALQDNRAKAGGVVVLDAKTGEILALANLPAYNPNNREHLSGAQLRNRAFTDIYEPGSTMKPFIAALALESGRYRFDSKIATAPGKLTVGNAVISDTHAHDVLTLAQVIQKSSNVGIVKVMLSFDREFVWRFFSELGFGKPLALGFPGESGGRLRAAAHWQPIDQATMAYGNGIAVTLMQLAHAYTIFSSDGVLLPLSLTKLNVPPQEGQRIISAKTAEQIRTMLEMVVSPGGTATRAQIPGYRVGGKTGTAHKLSGGKYVNKYVSSFVGMAPASNPRLIVAVMIDEPSAGKHFGGEVAAPVFAQVMGGALRAMGVANDAPLQAQQVRSIEMAIEEP